MSDNTYIHRETATVPGVQAVVYPSLDRELELRNIKRRLIEIRRGQLSLVKQVEELIDAVDTALLRY